MHTKTINSETIKKPKFIRLSKGFWHEFLPNQQLLSPQNIKIEIWNWLDKKIIDRWHPQVFCVGHCAVSPTGSRFALVGGCDYESSEISIFNSETKENNGFLTLNEKIRNATFGANDKTLYLATHEGNLYELNIGNELILNHLYKKDKTLLTQIKYDTENHQLFIIACPTKNKNPNAKDFVFIYHLDNQTITEIYLPDNSTQNIKCIEYFNGKLAILTEKYTGETADGVAFSNAQIYIFDVQKNAFIFVSDNFEIKSVFADSQGLAWSKNGILASIGLNEIFLLDSKNNFSIFEVETPLPT